MPSGGEFLENLGPFKGRGVVGWFVGTGSSLFVVLSCFFFGGGWWGVVGKIQEDSGWSCGMGKLIIPQKKATAS